MAQPPLTAPLRIGSVEIRNRVLLAPLAGIGNWFVRLQAHRYGAGMAFSEMISSFALAHRNRRTLEEMLRIDPAEGVVAIQLFGCDPDVMRGGRCDAGAGGPAAARPQHGLPGAEGGQDRGGRGAAARPRSRRRGREGGDRGVGAAGDGEAALGQRARGPIGARPRSAAGRRGGRRRGDLASAAGGRPPPRRARLRARPRARRAARGAGDRLRRGPHRRRGARAPTRSPAPTR